MINFRCFSSVFAWMAEIFLLSYCDSILSECHIRGPFCGGRGVTKKFEPR